MTPNLIVVQLGALALALFVSYAVIAAITRVLSMKEFPRYLDNATKGISNLFNGVFA